MRSIRITCALAGAVCVFAATAATAFASEFTASKFNGVFPLKASGFAVGTQTFKFGPATIVCEAAKVKGMVSEPSSSALQLLVSYKECTTPSIKVWGEPADEGEAPVKFSSNIEFTYHANGYVEMDAEATITAKHTGGCKVLVPEQVIPVKAEEDPEGEFSAAVFTNNLVTTENLKRFPTGEQSKLMISDEFKKLEWEFEEEEGSLCESLAKDEGELGKYKGKLEVGIRGGDLGVQ